MMNVAKPKAWTFKQLTNEHGVIRDRVATAPIIGWSGENPIVHHTDGSIETMEKGAA